MNPPIKLVITMRWRAPFAITPERPFPISEYECSVVVLNAETGDEIVQGDVKNIVYNIDIPPLPSLYEDI